MKTEHAQVLVVGGGIMGTGVAYHLAALGQQRVMLIERDYLCAGASGRNGGGVRAQFSSEGLILLMRESLDRVARFSREFGVHVWMRRGGYLFLTESEQRAAALSESAELQRRLGLDTRTLSGREARRIVPQLAINDDACCTFNPDDAVVFPWPFVWGYAQAAARLGVELRTQTELLSLERTSAGWRARCRGQDGEPFAIECTTVVCGAGAWCKRIAEGLGLDWPTRPHRHEICSSEPLKPWLGPLVANLDNGLYFSQSTRGEIVGGIGNDYVPAGFDQGSSYSFLARYAKALTRTCPQLGAVRVLRQWAGLYDLTADANPIVGFVPEAPGIYWLSGFMGHGFMVAPAITPRAAQEIVTGARPSEFAGWTLGRFASGELQHESMIIG